MVRQHRTAGHPKRPRDVDPVGAHGARGDHRLTVDPHRVLAQQGHPVRGLDAVEVVRPLPAVALHQPHVRGQGQGGPVHRRHPGRPLHPAQTVLDLDVVADEVGRNRRPFRHQHGAAAARLGRAPAQRRQARDARLAVVVQAEAAVGRLRPVDVHRPGAAVAAVAAGGRGQRVQERRPGLQRRVLDGDGAATPLAVAAAARPVPVRLDQARACQRPGGDPHRAPGAALVRVLAVGVDRPVDLHPARFDPHHTAAHATVPAPAPGLLRTVDAAVGLSGGTLEDTPLADVAAAAVAARRAVTRVGHVHPVAQARRRDGASLVDDQLTH